MWHNKILVVCWTLIFLGQYYTAVDSCASRKKHGINPTTTCASDTDCRTSLTFLRCTSRLCTCSSASHFDKESESCLLVAGASCTIKKNEGQSCVLNSECEPGKPFNKFALKGSCECSVNSVETMSGLCKLKSSASSIQVSSLSVFFSFWVIFVAIR